IEMVLHLARVHAGLQEVRSVVAGRALGARSREPALQLVPVVELEVPRGELRRAELHHQLALVALPRAALGAVGREAVHVDANRLARLARRALRSIEQRPAAARADLEELIEGLGVERLHG